VRLVFNDGIERRLSKAATISLAGSLRALADGGVGATIEELNFDAMFRVTRKGNGIKIMDVETGAERSASVSVARDLAEILERTSAALL